MATVEVQLTDRLTNDFFQKFAPNPGRCAAGHYKSRFSWPPKKPSQERPSPAVSPRPPPRSIAFPSSRSRLSPPRCTPSRSRFVNTFFVGKLIPESFLAIAIKAVGEDGGRGGRAFGHGGDLVGPRGAADDAVLRRRQRSEGGPQEGAGVGRHERGRCHHSPRRDPTAILVLESRAGERAREEAELTSPPSDDAGDPRLGAGRTRVPRCVLYQGPTYFERRWGVYPIRQEDRGPEAEQAPGPAKQRYETTQMHAYTREVPSSILGRSTIWAPCPPPHPPTPSRPAGQPQLTRALPLFFRASSCSL